MLTRRRSTSSPGMVSQNSRRSSLRMPRTSSSSSSLSMYNNLKAPDYGGFHVSEREHPQLSDEIRSFPLDEIRYPSKAASSCLQENLVPHEQESQKSRGGRTLERKQSAMRSRSSETPRDRVYIKSMRRASPPDSDKDAPRLPPFLGRHQSCAQIRCVSLPPICEDQAPAHFDWTREPVYCNGPDWPGYIKVPQAVPTEVNLQGKDEEEYPLQHLRSSTDSQRSTRGGSVISVELSDVQSINGRKKIKLVVKHAVKKVETLFSKTTYKDGFGHGTRRLMGT